MAKYHIYVTGLNASDDPSSGLGVIRCLQQMKGEGLKIIALTYELLDGVSYLDKIVDAVYVVPSPHDNEQAFINRLSQIVDSTKVNALVPNLDFEIQYLSKIQFELRELGIKALLPSLKSLEFCARENLFRLGEEAEVLTPLNIPVYDFQQIYSALTYYPFQYPLILKAAKGLSTFVYSWEEVKVFSNRLSAQWGWPIIIQQFVPGEEFSVAALADRRHHLAGYVCMKKILKSKNGSIWMGSTVQDNEVLDMTQRIIKKISWTGPLEIEFVKLSNTSQIFLIELKPRFPSWIQLAAQAECNIVKTAIMLAFNKKVDPLKDYKTGIMFARSEMEITCDIGRLAQLATRKELIYNDSQGSH